MLKDIIKRLYNRITGHDEIRRLFSNFSWLAFDRMFRLGVNLFIVGWIARYLGRDQYGNMDYAMSIAGIVGVIGSFGTNNIIVRDLVKFSDKRNEILGSSFLIRQIGGILVVLISFITVWILNPDDTRTQWMAVISSVTFLAGSLDVIDLDFQSQIKSKYSVIANDISFIIFTIVRISMILLKFPMMAFVIAGTSEVILAQVFMIISYYKTGHKILTWKWDSAIARGLLRDSWPLMLSLMSGALFLRIGQVMLGKMVNYSKLGEYAAAVKISEVWYFVPIVISSTVYPKLVEYKKQNEEMYRRRLQDVFTIITIISYGAVIPTFFFNKQFIWIIFGEQYTGAGIILSIHIWAGLFVATSIIRNCWCNVENFTRGIFYSTLAGAVINIILNVPFISLWGGVGAALATLVARIITGYISTIFMSRDVFIMQTKSFFLKGFWHMVREDFLKKM
ncbi:MAG: flippase [Spirochaetes bacterium]|nr:flippase [Spirochaetota bacterium]